MSKRKPLFVLPLFLTAFLTLFLSASNLPLANAASLSLLSSNQINVQSASPSVTTKCPAPGTGRAAVLPPLTLGKDQNIVYVSDQNSPTSTTFKRYDVATQSTTTILTLKGKNVAGTQISSDGKWILFVSEQTAKSTSTFRLQLVRLDGKYLQTLYCSKQKTGINDVQWSTDLKLIVFEVTSNGTENVYVLNTTNGSVQTDYSTPSSSSVIVRTWLDTHRVYLTNTQTDAPPNIIYLLDTNNPGKLQTVFNGSFSDFDSSYDGKSLYTSSCNCGLGGNMGPGSIAVQPALGGQQQTLYSSSKDAITSVRAVLPTTLLFLVENFMRDGGSYPDNGLWKINTDGSGVTRLTTEQAGQSTGLNPYSQFPWSNVSRDGNLYTLDIIGTQGGFTQTLEYGPISGGTPTPFATANGTQATLTVAGWTTM